MTIPDFVHDELAALELSLTGGQLETLDEYLDRVLETNRSMNLTAVREPDAAWRRLVIDSLTIVAGLEGLAAGSAVIDIGSGAGLPGIPVSVARPDLAVTLLEATGKKARFLESCAADLGLAGVRVCRERAETIGRDGDHRMHYDAAVSRAIGSMSEVLEYSLPLVKIGGRVLAMKGPKAPDELAAAGDALSILGAGDLKVFEAYPASFDNDLVIVSIIKERSTPPEYPRLPGVPHRDPL